MADNNPANFANLPKDRVQEIASMGGKVSHGSGDDNAGRNSDGTFTKDSEAAKQAGHIGGLHAAGKEDKENEPAGRREDGTFKPGSEAAKEAGHIGGLHAHSMEDAGNNAGRRDDGTFKPGSDAAKEAGHKGGVAAATSNN